MAAVRVDPKKIRSFKSEAEFEKWLSRYHDQETELWIKIHKKASGLPTVTATQAIDVALCWGWIDGIRKGFDERSFLQRYTPRKGRSVWSQINRDNVVRLTKAGRMTPHGQRHVDAAKADGRWDAAYAPMRTASVDSVPRDLRAAIAASAKAERFLHTLDRPNLFALVYRTNAMKTAAGRTRKIADLVRKLERGETLVQTSPRRQASAKATTARPAGAKGSKAKPAGAKRSKAKPAGAKSKPPRSQGARATSTGKPTAARSAAARKP